MRTLITLFVTVLALSQCTTKPESNATTQSAELLFTEPLGIAPYTFRRSWKNGIEATLDTIVGMGFTSIEGGGRGMDPLAYRQLCDAKGLSIPSMRAGYQLLVDSTASIIEKAKIYGAQYIMCAWIPHNTGNFGFEDAEKAVKDFNAFGKTLAENGLTFCYHPHGYELKPYGDGTLLDYIFENTNPDYVSFEMDIFWIQFGGGDPAALLEKYGDRWKLMHVKDMKKGIEKDLTGLTDPEHDVTVGSGQLDMPKILKAAKKVGIKHYFIEDESSRIITQIPESISYLRGLKVD